MKRSTRPLGCGQLISIQLTFAESRSSFEETKAKVRQVEEARWALEVHRTSHPKASSVDFARRLLEAFEDRNT